MKKVAIICASAEYRQMFIRLGFEVLSESQWKDADLLCFTGGSDVSATLYGDKQHHLTYSSEARDKHEAEVFMEASALNKPMVGICRGGQFLNVMSGGRMYQHVGGHLGDHEIIDVETGDNILVSSTHHQMMMPSEDAIILGLSTLGGHREWYDGEVFMRDISNTDYEVVLYEHTKCLCFQPHPEFNAPKYSRMTEFFRTLIQKHLGV